MYDLLEIYQYRKPIVSPCKLYILGGEERNAIFRELGDNELEIECYCYYYSVIHWLRQIFKVYC